MTTNNRKRKKFQATEKVAIIRKHLVENQSVSDLCDEHGVAPSLYYRWQKQFFEGGEAAFEKGEKSAVTRRVSFKPSVGWPFPQRTTFNLPLSF